MIEPTPCLKTKGAKVTDYHCAARRREQLKKVGQKSGWGGKAGMHDAAYLHCVDCERGVLAMAEVTLRPRMERVKEKLCASCTTLLTAKRFSKTKNGKYYKICKKCQGIRLRKGKEYARQQREKAKGTKQRMPEKAKPASTDMEKVIDDHWSYVEGVLKHANMNDEVIAAIGFHYKTAFEHGWKHACTMPQP